MIDWELARSTAHRLAPAGPDVSPDQAAEQVARLRQAAVDAVGPVEQVTGLTARDTPVLIIDRPRWAEANIASFQTFGAPLLDAVVKSARKPGADGPRRGTPLLSTDSIGAKVTGAELGAMLGLLSGRVLGQFDPFAEPDGRLLLVAPNVTKFIDALELDAEDFGLWVCLHEQTHRAQFTAVPWMRPHFESLIARFAEATEPGQLTVTALLENAPEIARIARGDSTATLSELFQSPEQRAVLGEITGMMSLLEGHADVVMDEVGPDVVPTVAAIRRRFDQRRAGAGWSQVLRRLLGFEAKMRQYRDGAAFVRTVTETAGHEAFSAVWAAPENLPTHAEILKPSRWLERVHA